MIYRYIYKDRMTEENQRDVQSLLVSFEDIIEDFKKECNAKIKTNEVELVDAIAYIKNRGMFANWAQPNDYRKTNAELNIRLAKETIRFCDVLKERIRKMTDSPDHKQVFVNIYDLLQNNLSELESERSISEVRTLWIYLTKNLVTTLLKRMPPWVSKARSKIMSHMQKRLIGECERYIRYYDNEIKQMGTGMSWYNQARIGSMHECIQLINELKKSLSKMENDDEAPVILAHYKEKVEQEESSYAKPLFASFREENEERTKRKATKYSFACKRQIMDGMYDVFHHQKQEEDENLRKYLLEYYPQNTENTVNPVMTVITKTLLRFRDMHDKLKRERKEQYGNDSALAAVDMKLTGINEILDFIESFRKQLDYSLGSSSNNLSTVNAFLEQMSTLLSQSSKETEDAKLNPIENIVVFLNEVKKTLVEREEAIAAAARANDDAKANARANDDAEANAPDRKPKPDDPNAVELQEVPTNGGRRCKRTGRKRSGKKRTSKKRKRTRRRH